VTVRDVSLPSAVKAPVDPDASDPVIFSDYWTGLVDVFSLPANASRPEREKSRAGSFSSTTRAGFIILRDEARQRNLHRFIEILSQRSSAFACVMT
jgi:hypothetical protein